MKRITSFLSIAFIASFMLSAQNFYDFTVENINGEKFDFEQLRGKKVLIVNTASKCGLTPQYEQLQELYETYGGDDFVIIGFPANNFMKQEPGTNEEIKTFCTANYGVTFPMMAKISVKGDDIHPVYQWLTEKNKNGKIDSKVKWNFQKYLIDEEGKLMEVFEPKVNPTSDEIVTLIAKK